MLELVTENFHRVYEWKPVQTLLDWGKQHPRFCLGISASGLALIYYVRSRAKNLPPGPTPLPIVGNLLSLSDQMHLDIARYKQQYGDVFTLYFGPSPTVVLASHSAIKEAFVTRGNDYSSRPVSSILNKVFDSEIFNAPASENWDKNKKFAVQTLRDFGGTKDGLGEKIVSELSHFMKLLDSQTPVDLGKVTILMTTNIISSIVFNERFEYDDPSLQELVDMVLNFYDSLNNVGIYVLVLPEWVLRILCRKPLQRLIQNGQKLSDHIAAKVDEHHKTFNSNHLRDVIDVYIAKRGEDARGRIFYGTMINLIAEAMDTMSILLRWIILYLGTYGDVQSKAREEVMRSVGTERMVILSDRSALSYIEAVIVESIRLCYMINMTAMHCSQSDTTFRGYNVPKSTPLFASIYCVHKDAELFPEPHKFYPERFLDENGQLTNTNLIAAFSMGKRMCIGENLTRSELFLFTANLLQRFSISFQDGEPAPSLEPVHNVFQCPQPYKAVFTPLKDA